MAKGNRGGKRGTSNARQSLNVAQNVYTEGDAGAYQKEANELLSGVQTVLDNFGYGDALKGIYYHDALRGEANASMNGVGHLSISKHYLKTGNDNDGYTVAQTFHGTGTHEAGHLVTKKILDTKIMPNASNLEKSVAWKNQKFEKEVIKEAKRRYGSNPSISKYGGTSFAEKVAEAVSDVYTNKGKAKSYSKVIVDVLHDANNGKFKPNIKVTQSELKRA